MYIQSSPISWGNKGKTISLNSPTELPKASHFLWNKNMVAQVNCRGYVISQFMQPEPAKYSHGPNLEAKTFIQPEQPFYTEHPGRFFYIKDHATGDVFSLPYEPMRKTLDSFVFNAEMSEVRWQIKHLSWQFDIIFNLDLETNLEYWSLDVKNSDDSERKLSIYTCFSIGYMSWMNQGATFEPELNTIVASSVTAYQKVEDYPTVKNLNDKTFLMSDKKATSWCCSFADFVGEGGLTQPDAIQHGVLPSKTVNYETPIAVLQHDVTLEKHANESLCFLFGPANNIEEISEIKSKCHLAYFNNVRAEYLNYVQQCVGNLHFDSPNVGLNHVVNYWLPRQAFYHGDVNRLSTDPQTRNYLQDAMGMIYLSPSVTRERLIFALTQQQANGELPDGILLTDEAELKYINQVPHADHNVWLSLVLLAYLEQTGDTSVLDEVVVYADKKSSGTVTEHVEKALDWLINNTDRNGLSLIAQGDWCDPMNMVGYKGKGVSSWLTFATAYAIKCWVKICDQFLPTYNAKKHSHYQTSMQYLNNAALNAFQSGKWFGRGITDDGRLFGTEKDAEGKMFLNAQSWAMLSGVTTIAEQPEALTQINQHLLTPYGYTMLAPSYTKMVEDVGRITQKSPGVSENGSVYNHAAIFYAYALFEQGLTDQAFDVLTRMIALPESGINRDQLPNFVPNYYRGAYFQFPDYAGRSSNLFNTGTISWLMRCVNEHLCGFKGLTNGVEISPQLPSDWQGFGFSRQYRGALFTVEIIRDANIEQQQTSCNGRALAQNRLLNIKPDTTYKIEIKLPYVARSQAKLCIIMGVSGSGKTAVAKSLASQCNSVFVDADDFHSEWAKKQMAQGIPLEDNYRDQWITKLSTYLTTLRCQKQNTVLAYSGLKQKHRERFRTLGLDVRYFNLKVSEPILKQRLQNRETHFFDPNLLASQLSSMEQITTDEQDVVHIDGTQPLEKVINSIKDLI
ncbi:AAA family ATPase [Psychrosphaera sp. B3R10]|uniref:gluconokinase, GntK/IdnK-type n=1 Tax=unclassified Psychrosphaera TaxID=2641570 RepID=UPI001C08D44A|nr:MULTISPECIES: gluconokinase, GntK/IdnK-type [unclassified Psychrosphaera]MBU2881146.1 AAA family ATPase [Psychrosphaera sp. I2R16]MBU2988251.1 AAA family ATPase [Psychrosphaera sp. B3R10]